MHYEGTPGHLPELKIRGRVAGREGCWPGGVIHSIYRANRIYRTNYTDPFPRSVEPGKSVVDGILTVCVGSSDISISKGSIMRGVLSFPELRKLPFELFEPLSEPPFEQFEPLSESPFEHFEPLSERPFEHFELWMEL